MARAGILFFPQPEEYGEPDLSNEPAIGLAIHFSQIYETSPSDLGPHDPGGPLRAVLCALERQPYDYEPYRRHYEWAREHRSAIRRLCLVTGGPRADMTATVLETQAERRCALCNEIEFWYGRIDAYLDACSETGLEKELPVDKERLLLFALIRLRHAFRNGHVDEACGEAQQVGRLYFEVGKVDLAERFGQANSLDSIALALREIDEPEQIRVQSEVEVSLAIHVVASGTLPRQLNAFIRDAGCTVQEDTDAIRAVRRMDDDRHDVLLLDRDGWLDDGQLRFLVSAAKERGLLTVSWSADPNIRPIETELELHAADAKTSAGLVRLLRSIQSARSVV
jgi:hypothetical protein